MKKKILSLGLIFLIICSVFNISYGVDSYNSTYDAYEDEDYDYYEDEDEDNYDYLNYFKSYYDKEYIEDYDIEIHVNEDSSMDVTEKIIVYANNQKITHGIFRDFPTQYENKKVSLKVNSVECDGDDVNYSLESVTRGIRIKIGNSDENVSIGKHEYIINYTTTRQITYEDDYDELYWNVIGSGWDFRINNCHAIVYFPEGTKFIKEDLGIYTGAYGNKDRSVNVYYDFLDNKNAVEFETMGVLDKNEAFTIDVFIEKGTLMEPSFSTKCKWFVQDNIIPLILFIGFFLLLIWQYFKWKKYGKDPKQNIIIPRYYPPKDLDPGEMEYIRTMGKSDKALESIIINLAIKGYFRFDNDEKKKNVIVINKITHSDVISKLEPLDANEKEVYDSFDVKETLKYSSSFQAKLAQIKLNIEKNMKEKYEGTLFVTNSKMKTQTILASILTVIIAFIVGAFVNPYAAGNTWLYFIFDFMLAGIFAVAIYILYNAFSKGKNKTFISIIVIIFWIIPMLLMILGFFSEMSSVYIGNIAMALLIVCYILDILVFGKLIGRYTDDGMRIKEEIEGFKMFVNTAKDDDFADKTPEMYDKYFAYAYVLGLENKWAEKFEDVIIASNYSPSWCSGNMVYINGGFDTRAFTKSFSSNMSSGMSRASTAPSSSGGSGFSGGGFSGGGGGGRRSEEAGKVY